MKKIVLCLLLVLIAVSVEARDIEPGAVKLSGSTNASFFKSSIDEDGDEIFDVDTFSLSTDAIYFLTKNVGVGGTIAYEKEKTKYPDGWRDEVTTVIIGPSVAVDIPIKEMLNFIAGATIGYFQIEFEDGTGKYLDADGLAWQVSAGVAIFPARQVSLDLVAAYQFLDGDDSVGDINFEASSMGLNLGVSVYFD